MRSVHNRVSARQASPPGPSAVVEAEQPSAAPTCPRVDVAALAPPSLDPAYMKTFEMRAARGHPQSVPLTNQVAGQLNTLLYPLVFALHHVVKELDAGGLTQVAIDVAQATPPQVGAYVEGLAQVTGSRAWASKSHIAKNAGSPHGQHLQLDELPEKATQFAFRSPTDDLVSELGATMETLGLHITPVGPYGLALAEDMVLTTAVLVALAREHLSELSAATLSGNENLLYQESARGRNAFVERTKRELAPLGVTVEGIVSLNQVLALLLLDEVPGAVDGPAALRALVFDGRAPQGLTTDFTARVAMGVTGPTTLKGRGFDAAVERTADGIALTRETTETLADQVQRYRAHRPKAGVCPLTGTFKGVQGLSPPPADGEKPLEKPLEKSLEKSITGIQLLSETYWRVFEVVHALRRGGAPA